MTECLQVICSCQFYNGFIIDAFGWPLIDYNPSLSDGWHIPTYPHWSRLNQADEVFSS